MKLQELQDWELHQREKWRGMAFFMAIRPDGIFQIRRKCNYICEFREGQTYQPNAITGEMFVLLISIGRWRALDDNDKTKFGKGMPDWTFGLSLGAEWKGSIEFIFQGTRRTICSIFLCARYSAMNRPSWILERWHVKALRITFHDLTQCRS